MRLGRAWRRMVAVGGALTAAVTAAALLLHWGVLCTNLQIWRHVNRVCIEHMSGEALGNLCEPLCVVEAMEALACHSSTGRRDAVFGATYNGKRLLFKSPERTSLQEPELLYWIDEKKNRHYPTNEQFKNMIKELVTSKMNITITDEKADELSRLPESEESDSSRIRDASRRETEMDNVWALLQDYDYLLTVLFSRGGLFPERAGTCGSLYAVEYADPIRGSSPLFSLEDTEEEWERRARLAILILDLLERLDRARLRLCGVELAHFGSTGGKLRYLQPGEVRSRTSSCPGGGVDSLQTVCERVYLGWAAQGRVLLPGLLVSRRAPAALAALLRRCADPLAAPLPHTLRRALYNTLLKRH